MLILLAATMAQAGPAKPHAPPQEIEAPNYFAVLDEALAKQDYAFISEQTLKPKSALQAKLSLDWLGTQFRQGASPMIALTYARLLMSVAHSVKAEEADSLRGTALAAMIYAAASSAIVDRQCADKTAWGNRRQQIARLIRQSDLLSLDDSSRRFATAIALHIEKSTWESRKLVNDAAFLCMNGMAAMSAGIARGQVKEVKRPKGQLGREMSVKVPDGFVYERRKNEDWWADAETLRAQLPTVMMALANVDRLPTEAELRASE